MSEHGGSGPAALGQEVTFTRLSFLCQRMHGCVSPLVYLTTNPLDFAAFKLSFLAPGGAIMQKLKWTVLGSTLVLGACTTPFAQSDRLDLTPHQVQASITLSQPKVYRREALLNERARDLAWIDDLIDKSTTAVFTPDVIREVEQITSVAASISLSIDPAAGANFGRASETAGLQEEINVLRLQLQLEQLQRDAELYRATLAGQEAPVNQGLGSAPAGTVAPSS